MNNPFHFFEKIYCINLDHRTDRWQQCCDIFNEYGITDKVERFSAVQYKHKDQSYSKAMGQLGCSASHFEITKNALERKLENYLVLEDDFCFLDDDTTFHENMYMKYLDCTEEKFVGMLVGEQIFSSGKLRLVASKPVFTKIDTGNVISHHSCLTECTWPETFIYKVNQRDFLFWESVYNYYGMKCAIWNSPISYYNKLRDE